MVHQKTLQNASDARQRVRLVADSLGVDTATPKKIMEILSRAEVSASRATVSRHLNDYRRELSELDGIANASESVADESEATETPDDTTEPESAQEDDAQSDAKRIRIWPLYFLMLPAFIAVWSGWVGIGEMTGFGEVNLLPGIGDGFEINSAITLPVGLEAYAGYALYVWLSGKAAKRALKFAKISAITSLAVGGLGQIAFHIMEAAGVETAPWWITAGVSCIPVAVVGMAAGLAHVANSDR